MSAAQTLNPAEIAQPAGAYSQAVLTEGAGRTLHIAAGQGHGGA